LTVTLNIQQSEYVAAAGDTAGAVVVILPQNQMPFPEDQGILVSPGHATSVALTQVRHLSSHLTTATAENL
jgi:Amiloride-sensitive sodium channel